MDIRYLQNSDPRILPVSLSGLHVLLQDEGPLFTVPEVQNG